MKIIIVSPKYNENSGGVIALHKLCHYINELNGDAYLYPYIDGDYDKSFFNKIKDRVKVFFCDYNTNVNFKTPLIRYLSKKDKECSIVLYPEIVSGNPLNAKNVVRWFLHNPGYHTGKVKYGRGELYFTYGSFGMDFSLVGSKLINNKLEVTHLFSEYYNMEDVKPKRSGTSYCIRKGKGRPIIHNINDSILIDGLTHKEIALIFKRTEFFISYDLHTAYWWLAILCGCIPIIVPDETYSFDELYPDKSILLGTAYGFSQGEINKAREEIYLAQKMILSKEKKEKKRVEVFLQEIENFFSLRK